MHNFDNPDTSAKLANLKNDNGQSVPRELKSMKMEKQRACAPIHKPALKVVDKSVDLGKNELLI